MELHLTDAERAALRALQRQHRDGPGYVQVTVVLLLDKGRSVPPTHADAMGLNQIASLSVSAFFGLVVVWELLMIKGWRN